VQKEKAIQLEELPEKFRKAVVKLMAAEDMDVLQALDFAAVLVEKNSEAWNAELQSRANTLYKSRHMSELNKSRAEWDKVTAKKLEEEHRKGYKEGEKFVKEVENVWHVPCSVCGERMTFYTWNPGFVEAYAALKEAFADWHHSDCSTG